MASLVMRSLAALLACAALLVHSYYRAPSASAGRALCPDCNVVLISVDTVRADHVGAYGYPVDTTPNIDKLAMRSVVFERAISQAPWTLPAHGAMFSGLYPQRLGVVGYPAVRKLPDVHQTLPERLRLAGYATGGFTGGGFVAAHYGFSRGFDTYTTNGRRFEHNVRQALDWLDTNKNRRFFLFFHGYDAHRPYYSSAKDKEAVGLPPNLPVERLRFCFREERARPDDASLREILSYYDAAIRHGDRELGPFFERLEQLGLMENTVIVLTSDHGEEFFEHGNCDHVRFVYEESVHVPLMVYVPGFSPEGHRVKGLVPASISVARTVLDLVGLEHGMPGVSLVPEMKGQRDGFPVVYSHANSPAGSLGSRGEVIAATRERVKLVSYTEEGASEGYNLIDDPREQNVLPEGHEAYKLRNTLRAWREAVEPLPKPKPGPPLTPEERADKERRRDRAQRLLKARMAREPAFEGGAALDKEAGAAAAAARAKKFATSKGPAPEGPATKPAPSPPPAPDPPAEEGLMEDVPDHVRESLKALGYIEE